MLTLFVDCKVNLYAYMYICIQINLNYAYINICVCIYTYIYRCVYVTYICIYVIVTYFSSFVCLLKSRTKGRKRMNFPTSCLMAQVPTNCQAFTPIETRSLQLSLSPQEGVRDPSSWASQSYISTKME